MNIEAYVKERFERQLEWYERRARWARQRSLFVQIYQLVFLLAIPLLLLGGGAFFPFSDFLVKIIASVFAMFAAVLVAMEKFLRLDTSWEQYRFIAERLRREYLSFQMSLGDYEHIDTDKKAKLFVERSESLMNSELSRWFVGSHSEGARK